jgi:hypothetical protein
MLNQRQVRSDCQVGVELPLLAAMLGVSCGLTVKGEFRVGQQRPRSIGFAGARVIKLVQVNRVRAEPAGRADNSVSVHTHSWVIVRVCRADAGLSVVPFPTLSRTVIGNQLSAVNGLFYLCQQLVKVLGLGPHR